MASVMHGSVMHVCNQAAVVLHTAWCMVQS